MNQFVNGVARAMAETVDCPGPILEIGSYQVAGQESLGNLRSLFPGKAYTGVDKRSGPGVDQVADVEALPFADASVGTVLAFNLFEHVARFWKGLDEVWRVLRPDGVLLMSCPFYFHIHAYPGDYWRFTPEAMKLLLERFPSKVLGWNGPRSRPAHVWAVGLREAHAAVTSTQYRAFQARLAAYGHQPLGVLRRLRYRLGCLVSGRRPFSPYLDRERWETEWLTNRVRGTRRPSAEEEALPLPTGTTAGRPLLPR